MMKTKLRTGLLLLGVLCLSCGNDSSGPAGTGENVRVSVAPDKTCTVESAGGKISFSVTTEPVGVALKYLPSVGWIEAVAGEPASWQVAPNESELSRNGRIYILEAASLAHLDTIRVVQKSRSGEIQEEPELEFSEQDVPVAVPFAGNSYITDPVPSSFINSTTGAFSGDWTDGSLISGTYFRVGNAGELNLAVMARNATGSSLIRFTVDGKSYDVRISGPTLKMYPVARLERAEPGYVRVDMQGISRSGKTFGEVTGFRIGGQASVGQNYFVTDEKIAEANTSCYFVRRGSSVHYFYTLPSADTEYFYNEVLVAPEDAVNSSYYMMNGFSEGYMGIQQTTSGERKVLFSVWSPYTSDNPSDIPEEKRVKLLRKGADVTVGDFGNEGSGAQSWLNYAWKPGTVYKALVRIAPDGTGATVYTAYFYADGRWRLIASFKRPDTNTYYKGAYSFLENFDPSNSIFSRSVTYRNQWARLASGEWKEVTEAKFSCDGTGRAGLRYDYAGALSDDGAGFVLRSFGFFDDHTEYGTMLRRQTGSVAPEIDFEALEQIPSFN